MKKPLRLRTVSATAVPARERIFNAALRLLRAGGTEAATLRAICDEAGITPPTPKETTDQIWTAHVESARNEPGLFEVWNRHIAWLTPISLHSYQTLVQSFQALGKDCPLKVPAEMAAHVFLAAAQGMACLIAASQHDGVPYANGAAEKLKEAVLHGIFARYPFF